MNAGPVIVRELRAEARRPINHWLRLLAAGAGLGVVGTLMVSSRLPPALLGGYLFSALHTTLFVTFLIVVPLMTADCISQERREGTLGLLFLTPLSAFDIIAGKSLVHIVRAVTLFLAAIPVLTIPFLLGGVGWRQALAAVMFEGCAVLLGLAAGLLATSKGGSATQVMVWAEVYAAGLAVLFGLILDAVSGTSPWLTRFFPPAGPAATSFTVLANGRFVSFYGSTMFPGGPPVARAGTAFVTANGPVFLRGSGSFGPPLWFGLMGVMPLRGGPGVSGRMLVFGLLLLTFAVARAVRRLDRTWQEESAAPEQPRWVRIFSDSQFWRAVFRWDKSLTLDRNPIAWLQEYSWTARLTKWGWCLLMLGAEIHILRHVNRHDAFSWQPVVTAVLVLGLAFSAVSSFRRERQTGLLELLLVTPLSAQQLVVGRLWGIWCHFFPATAILVVGWIAESTLGTFELPLYYILTSVVPLLATYLILPMIGLHFSLWRIHVLVAWMLTVIVGLVVPAVTWMILGAAGRWDWWFVWCLLQWGFATLLNQQLCDYLTRRKFALQTF